MSSVRPDDETSRTDDDLMRADAEAVADDDLGDDVDANRSGDVARRRMRRVASQVYSIRIPVDRLEDLRQLAAARNEAPTGLIRRWVLERLDAETLGHDPVTALAPGVAAPTAESLQRAVESLATAVRTLTEATQARACSPADAMPAAAAP